MLRPIRKVEKRKIRFSVNSQNLLYTIFCESTVTNVSREVSGPVDGYSSGRYNVSHILLTGIALQGCTNLKPEEIGFSSLGPQQGFT